MAGGIDRFCSYAYKKDKTFDDFAKANSIHRICFDFDFDFSDVRNYQARAARH